MNMHWSFVTKGPDGVQEQEFIFSPQRNVGNSLLVKRSFGTTFKQDKISSKHTIIDITVHVLYIFWVVFSSKTIIKYFSTALVPDEILSYPGIENSRQTRTFGENFNSSNAATKFAFSFFIEFALQAGIIQTVNKYM